MDNALKDHVAKNVESEFDVSRPMCYGCRHLDQDSVRHTCSAFPGGIPAPIWFSQYDHREPFPGDHGIRFEPIEAEGE